MNKKILNEDFTNGGNNFTASAGWATFDTYMMSYQDEEAQDAVGAIQLMAMLILVSQWGTSQCWMETCIRRTF